MHQNIGAATGGLVIGQGHGQLRVHDGEPGPGVVGIAPPLEPAVLVGDNRGIAHLAAGGGNGDDDAYRGAGGGGALEVIEIPGVAAVGKAIADGLGRVDDAAAAHGQEEVDALLPAKLQALPYQADAGVGHHAAQLHMGDPRRVQGGLHPVQKPGALDAATAVVDEDLGAPLGLDQLAHLVHCSLSEDYLSRGKVLKIHHNAFPPAFIFDRDRCPGIFWKNYTTAKSGRQGSFQPPKVPPGDGVLFA